MTGCRIPREALERVDPALVRAELEARGWYKYDKASDGAYFHQPADEHPNKRSLFLPHAMGGSYNECAHACLADIAAVDDVCPRAVAARCARKEVT